MSTALVMPSSVASTRMCHTCTVSVTTRPNRTNASVIWIVCVPISVRRLGRTSAMIPPNSPRTSTGRNCERRHEAEDERVVRELEDQPRLRDRSASTCPPATRAGRRRTAGSCDGGTPGRRWPARTRRASEWSGACHARPSSGAPAGPRVPRARERVVVVGGLPSGVEVLDVTRRGGLAGPRPRRSWPRAGRSCRAATRPGGRRWRWPRRGSGGARPGPGSTGSGRDSAPATPRPRGAGGSRQARSPRRRAGRG